MPQSGGLPLWSVRPAGLRWQRASYGIITGFTSQNTWRDAVCVLIWLLWKRGMGGLFSSSRLDEQWTGLRMRAGKCRKCWGMPGASGRVVCRVQLFSAYKSSGFLNACADIRMAFIGQWRFYGFMVEIYLPETVCAALCLSAFRVCLRDLGSSRCGSDRNT